MVPRQELENSLSCFCNRMCFLSEIESEVVTVQDEVSKL